MAYLSQIEHTLILDDARVVLTFRRPTIADYEQAYLGLAEADGSMMSVKVGMATALLTGMSETIEIHDGSMIDPAADDWRDLLGRYFPLQMVGIANATFFGTPDGEDREALGN